MKRFLITSTLLVISSLAFYIPAQAQTYAISWWTVDGGGGYRQ